MMPGESARPQPMYPPNTKFHIIITGRNHKDYWRQSVDSALQQEYPRTDFHVTLVNDASTDGSMEEMVEWHGTEAPEWNVDMDLPTLRRGAMANVYAHVGQWFEADEVSVLMSSDDYLKHENVLSVLDRLYRNPEVWLTYGNYEATDGSASKAEVYRNENFRREAFNCLPLNTFRASLFHKIDFADLRMGSQWMPSSEDVAIHTPMMEMAGLDRIRRIDEVLYVYRVHPGNAASTEKITQDACFWLTRQRDVYSRLPNLESVPTRAPSDYRSSSALLCLPRLHGMSDKWHTSLEMPCSVDANGDPLLHFVFPETNK